MLPQDQLDLLWKNTIGYLEGTEPGAHQGVRRPGQARRAADRRAGQRQDDGLPLDLGSVPAAALGVSPGDARQLPRTPAPTTASRTCSASSAAASSSSTTWTWPCATARRSHETEDQAVFLSAMDGITVNEGVVFVFTTNCSLDLIDRAFKRPGRLDLVLHFKAPDAELRRQLIERWHADIRGNLDIDDGGRLDRRLQLRGDRGAEEPAGDALHGQRRRGTGAGR